MTDPKVIQELLKRYSEGIASSHEREIVEKWVTENEIENKSWKNLGKSEQENLVKKIENDLLDYIKYKEDSTDDESKKIGTPWYRKIYFHLAAACVVILVGVSGWYFAGIKSSAHTVINKQKQKEKQEVVPGTNKAVLTLSDGGTVELNDEENGILANQQNTEIHKQGSELIYNQQKDINIKVVAFNVLTTPRGGQYNLILPDGTHVWLNAASSIKFPVAFKTQERIVEVTGEVYFEVAPVSHAGKKVPFQVKVFSERGDQVSFVEVMGTHFNINAYSEEAAVSTTLLEGRVKVSASINPDDNVVLSVAQQAQINNSNQLLKVLNNVNIEEVVAWKNGLFMMKKAEIPVVLRQLSRWYDVDIVYVKKIPAGRITGDMPRSMPLAEVLKIMELSGVKCKIENRKIIVEN